jgi:hypothetical protein
MKSIATILVIGGVVVVGYLLYSNYTASQAQAPGGSTSTLGGLLGSTGVSAGNLLTNLSEDYSSLTGDNS